MVANVVEKWERSDCDSHTQSPGFESPSESGPAQRVMDHFECLNLILAQSPPNLTYDIQYHMQA
jgi:hypothetical protein